jgi:hypothetical protein
MDAWSRLGRERTRQIRGGFPSAGLCIAVTLLAGFSILLAPTHPQPAPINTEWTMTATPLNDGSDQPRDTTVIPPAPTMAPALVAGLDPALPSLAHGVIRALGLGVSLASTNLPSGRDVSTRAAIGAAASAVLSAIRLEPPGYLGRAAGALGYLGRSGTGFTQSATWPD